MKREIEAYFFLIQYNIVKSNHPPIPSHSRVSRRHQLLSPNPLSLFNSLSPATAQKPLPPIRHICGLGASVGCERVERTFNAPRLKSQICLIGGNGFVCSVSNELNIDYDTFIADSVENAKKQVEGMLLDHWKEQIVYLEDCIDLLQNKEE